MFVITSNCDLMGFGDMMLLKYVICSIYTLYCYENRQNLMKNTYKSHDIVIVCLLASYFIRSNVSLSLLCTEQNVCHWKRQGGL